MIKLTKKYLLVFLTSSVFIPIIASANCTKNGCTSKVDTLYLASSGNVFIGTPDDEKLLDCDPVAGVYISLQAAHKNFEAIYSALLAAQLADKTVTLRIVNGSSSCLINYVTMKRQ